MKEKVIWSIPNKHLQLSAERTPEDKWNVSLHSLKTKTSKTIAKSLESDGVIILATILAKKIYHLKFNGNLKHNAKLIKDALKAKKL